MELYYTIVMFIFGTVFGSFYNVVGSRLPNGQSIVNPPSHCDRCGHRLGAIELIPIISFLCLKGKCRICKQKLSWFHPFFEFMTGILFALSYYIFGFTVDLAISLTFISMLLVIIVSDYQTMIIPDEVLIVGIIFLIIELFIRDGFPSITYSLLNGVIAFGIMFLLKKFGDFLFKKESMGGGDIKLMFVYGLVLGWEMTVISIFFASFIGLPVSLLVLYKKKDNVIPFGPFLAIAAIILFLSGITFPAFIDIILKRTI